MFVFRNAACEFWFAALSEFNRTSVHFQGVIKQVFQGIHWKL